jgi:hypothetical protein
MPNKRYIAGRQLEYLIKKSFESKKYIVLRSAGSKGVFDIVAIHFEGFDGHAFFLQVKKNISKEYAKKYLLEIMRKLGYNFKTKEIPIIPYLPYQEWSLEHKKRCFYLSTFHFRPSIYIGVIYTLPKKKRR